jgi:CRISPR-associated protein Cmr3
MMAKIGIVLEPLDTVFFRGGCPFGPRMCGESGLPTPQNFAGALRTWLLEREGADFGRMRNQPSLEAAFAAAGAPWLAQVRFRGPWLAEISERSAPKPFVRAPADVVLVDGSPTRLRPLRTPLPGWSPPAEDPGMLPLWLKRGRPEKARPAWLSFEGLRAYLEGRQVEAPHLPPADSLYRLEERTGIQVEAVRQSAEEGLIYTTRNLRLQKNVAFYGEMELPPEKANVFDGEQVMSWGGERHHVVVHKAGPVRWPRAVDGARSLLLLIAPAFFAARWRPDNLPEGALRAAAVEGPFVVSGWDLAAGGPKPARFGVAAGSVYFLEGAPPPESLCASAEDALAGYGDFLRGSWNYAE